MVKWTNPKKIRHNPSNPRRSFVNLDIRKSMASEGYKEEFPLVVRPTEDKKYEYEIVEGDCRLDSALWAGIPEVAYVERKLDDKQAFIESIKENVLRQNFEPIEEAKAFLRLKEDFGMNNVKIAFTVCKTEAYVRGIFDMLNLDEEIQGLVGKSGKGKIPLKHAEFISEIEDKDIQKLLATKVLTEGTKQQDFRRLVGRVKKVKDIEKAKKVIGITKDHLSMIKDKFKKSSLFKKDRKEKKEKKSEEQIASLDFEKLMSDLASFGDLYIGSAIEISSLDKYDLKEIYRLSKDKKTLKKYIKGTVKNKEMFLKFLNSDFFNRLKKVV